MAKEALHPIIEGVSNYLLEFPTPTEAAVVWINS